MRFIADEALTSGDGYAAREIASFRRTALCLDDRRHQVLIDLAVSSGLGAGSLPEPLLDSLLVSVDVTEKALDAAVRRLPCKAL